MYRIIKYKALKVRAIGKIALIFWEYKLGIIYDRPIRSQIPGFILGSSSKI
ncbi:MAG: hypothetical protein ACRC62_10465 [Microcoleus sp.]